MVCPICAQSRVLLVNEAWAGEWQSACKHGACEQCLRQWVDSQIPQCRKERLLRLKCFSPGCSKTLCQRLVLHVSADARHLADKLEQRFDLEKNVFFPEPLQVDCPCINCVGIGYRGFNTLMCFICDYQWPATDTETSMQIDGLPDTVKQCPRCCMLIEKDGGCDHITCPCGYDFIWTTMEMWNPEYTVTETFPLA